jgi:hypothetical protein
VAARSTWRTFAWGLLAAASLVIVAGRPRQVIHGIHLDEAVFLICFCVLFAFQLWVWRDRSGFWWFAAATATLMATAGTGYTLANAANHVLLAIGIAVMTMILIRITLIAPTVDRGLLKHFGGTFTPEDAIATELAVSFTWPLLLIMLAKWLNGGGTASWNGQATGWVVGIALAGIGVFGTFRYMNLYAQDRRTGPCRKSEENAWAAYIAILAPFYATLYGIFAVTRASAPIMAIDVRAAASIPDLWKIAATAGAALILALFGATTARRTELKPGHGPPTFRGAPVQLGFAATSITCVALLLWASTPWALLLSHRAISYNSAIFPHLSFGILLVIFAFVMAHLLLHRLCLGDRWFVRSRRRRRGRSSGRGPGQPRPNRSTHPAPAPCLEGYGQAVRWCGPCWWPEAEKLIVDELVAQVECSRAIPQRYGPGLAADGCPVCQPWASHRS